jgi:hypothetical protein
VFGLTHKKNWGNVPFPQTPGFFSA